MTRRQLLTLSPTLLLTGCLDPCGYQDLREFPSPDGRTIAAVYTYDCGATTGFTTRVNLRRLTSFDPKENVVLLLRHRLTLDVTWPDNQTLRIACPYCTADNRVYLAKQDWRNIRIVTRGIGVD